MSKTVLVTGASGFLASHIVLQLVQQGYHVRGTTRGQKVKTLQDLYSAYPTVEIVQLDDITSNDFGDILKGVYAVIHTAVAFPNRYDTDTVLKVAIDGALNILREGEKVGIKKFVVTSSFSAVYGAPNVVGTAFRAEHWNPVTREDAYKHSQLAYPVSKTLGEKAVWEWAEANPHVDVTTIVPPYLFGPFAPVRQQFAPGDWKLLTTNIHINKLVNPTGNWPFAPTYVDVRDAARAHVAALEAAEDIQGRKRILLASPHVLDFADLLKLIAKARPDLAGRLTKIPIPEFPVNGLDLDFERIEEVLKIKKSDFRTVEETFLEAIDSVLEVEEDWKAQGYTFEEIPDTY